MPFLNFAVLLKPVSRHVFDPQWEVEKMPGPRCIFDGVLLPNGHIVLIGGQKVGTYTQLLCQCSLPCNTYVL